jgi:hypothetical protein
MVKSKKKSYSKNVENNRKKAPIRIKREKSSSLRRTKIKSETNNRIRGLRESRKVVKANIISSKSPVPKKKKKEEKFIPLYEKIDSENISEASDIEMNEEEEIINTDVRSRNKSRNRSGNKTTIKRRSNIRSKSSSMQKLLNKKQSYSTSKAGRSSRKGPNTNGCEKSFRCERPLRQDEG